LNPAAAAYQLTYSLKRLFLLAAGFGVLSGWVGLAFSYLFNIPSGATIVITSSMIFLLAAVFSPKRRKRAWNRNAPGQASKTAAYFNSQAGIWDEKIAEKDTGKLERMTARLDIQPGSAVLDAGTGTGVLIPYLLKKIGQDGRLVCLDPAEKMLARAREKNFPGHIQFVLGDIEKTQMSEDTFDAVVCYSSFPHFADKPEALRKIRRLLKPGGKVFICHTSSRSDINRVHQQIPGLSGDLLPGEKEMRRMLEKAGFTRVEVEDGEGSYWAKGEKGLPTG
jgi:SAM-dependent methyltransferase